VPRALDQRVEGLGDAEALVLAPLDHARDRIDAARLQLAGGGLELVDLGGGEAIARALVPVDRAIDGVEVEAHGLGFRRPTHAGKGPLGSHRTGCPPAEWADEPKPPRAVEDPAWDEKLPMARVPRVEELHDVPRPQLHQPPW